MDLPFGRARYEEGLRVYVDNDLLSASDYSVLNGYVVLSADYLSTLSPGVHTLTTSRGYTERFRVL